ncbi:helix-turn-helix transcriptional regulator [Anaeromassilibacillus sp. An200]|uniref:helix-turn-helix transcriptional regulator n=1 Tax=Anaeromassilibacillus sp. An200 TaxID=1965587 RepID=UPI0013A659D6|nr:helix-turn-helix transcriptional regulator [Anaeromassilibacillus sp. An200]
MNERIKKLRQALNLSQDEFGKRLGVTRGAITNIELNKVEPKPLFVDLICREFNASENWIRTGEGEMFVEKTESEELAAFFGDLLKDEPDFRHRLIAAMSRLTLDEWKVLEKLAVEAVEGIKKDGSE